jgi:hypothetical protein
MRQLSICLIGLAMLAHGPAVLAGAPAVVPVQGILTDAQGVPLEGNVSVRFSIYDSQNGPTALWSEVQDLSVWMGLFTAYLGAVETLDLACFRDHEELWLGIQVASDAEMPRILVGSTPFSGYAEYSSYTGGEGIVVAPTNIISSILGSSIESDEITDGTVTGDDISDGTILRQDLAQDGCQPGQTLQWSGSEWACTDPPSLGILSGQAAHGETIPLPSGFTQDRCHWIVSPREVGVENDVGLDRIICRTDANRLVYCRLSYEDGPDLSNCTVNYLIICQ